MEEPRTKRRSVSGVARRALYHAPSQPAEVSQPTVHQQSKAHKPGFFFGRRWMLIIIVILIAGLAFLAYGYVHTKNQLEAAKKSHNTTGNTEIEQITNRVSESVSLPTGETPVLATVSDVNKLKGQVFFQDAQNGDKVLFYQKAGKAILYRPSTKKIIEFTSINLSNNR